MSTERKPVSIEQVMEQCWPHVAPELARNVREGTPLGELGVLLDVSGLAADWRIVMRSEALGVLDLLRPGTARAFSALAPENHVFVVIRQKDGVRPWLGVGHAYHAPPGAQTGTILGASETPGCVRVLWHDAEGTEESAVPLATLFPIGDAPEA